MHLVGKTTDGDWEAAGAAEYGKRLSAGFNPIQLDTTFHKTDQQLERAVSRARGVLVLDERGTMLSSTEFAQTLRGYLESSGSKLAFAIGGADGLPATLRGLPLVPRPGRHKELPQQALMSLGRLTFPHRLARVLLVEQIYRAQEIWRGSAYHRDG